MVQNTLLKTRCMFYEFQIDNVLPCALLIVVIDLCFILCVYIIYMCYVFDLFGDTVERFFCDI